MEYKTESPKFLTQNVQTSFSHLIASSITMLDKTPEVSKFQKLSEGNKNFTSNVVEHKDDNEIPAQSPKEIQFEKLDETSDDTIDGSLSLDIDNLDHDYYPTDLESPVRDLLKNWNLEILTKRLIDENITIEVLKIIKPDDINKLIRSIPIGTQALFKHNLELWRNDTLPFNTQQELLNSLHDSQSSVSSSRTETPISYRYSPYMEKQSPYRIDLFSVINESAKGNMLQSYYEKYGKFQEVQRNILINLMCQYFNDKNLHMSLTTSHKLETEICELFRSEKLEFYRTGKRGRLYNRCSNLKTHFKPICLETKIISENKLELVPEADVETCERSLKFDNLSSEEFDRLWKGCSKYRLKQITELKTTSEFFEKWPYYAKPSGFRLIRH